MTPPGPLLHVLLVASLGLAAGPFAPLPGEECHAAGTQRRFFAEAWQNTCECAPSAAPPQPWGNWCNWWTGAPKCGYCCTGCMERKDQACRVYDNVKMIPVMYEREFGTLANKTIPCVLEGDHLSGGCDWSDASGQNSGLNSMPKGHKSLRLYDADEYLDVEAGDLVELPAEFADCADPCSAKPRSKTIPGASGSRRSADCGWTRVRPSTASSR